jgi:FkbM family methyltransferase
MKTIMDIFRRMRTASRKAFGREPTVAIDIDVPMEFHGNDYCGWNVPCGILGAKSIVVDVGVGEDISFSCSLIEKFGCRVFGFDPTPRAVAYAKRQSLPNFKFFEYGLGATGGPAKFYLPSEQSHVSGSITHEQHLGLVPIDVELIDVDGLFRTTGTERITLLKMDIEGAEYDVIASSQFRRNAARIDVLCIEFHHRWPNIGSASTIKAVECLRGLGFRCAWVSPQTNEEFLFINASSFPPGVPHSN